MSQSKELQPVPKDVNKTIAERASVYATGMMGIGEWRETWHYGDKVQFNNLKNSYRLGADYGYSLAASEISTLQKTIEEQKKEIERLEGLIKFSTGGF